MFHTSLYFLALTLCSGLASATVLTPASPEELNRIKGSYEEPSGTRISYGGYTEKECLKENGEFQAEDSCTIYSKAFNTIEISEGVVHISTIWGSANMRDFDGAITGKVGNAFIVHELDENFKKVRTQACIISLMISKSGVATMALGKNCDSGLHIEKAKKTEDRNF